ncbi:uncharacterized protein VTP21DRAFT_8687 [Calcarisporiella thermophila]|uniref:uncharacterized protein n=1 Tax=Calcarisporiella thermophila TaxID=911321 RepID=UPI00374374EF
MALAPTPTAQSPAFSHGSPTIATNATPAAISTPSYHAFHKKEVVVLCVIEGTAKMKEHFAALIDNYIDPIMKQLRTPVIMEGDDKQQRTKITPTLKYGLVVYGDYEPFSAVTVDRKYFTQDFRTFSNMLRNLEFRNGGLLQNATGEGLVAALEMFDMYKQRRHPDSPPPILHCILVAASPPHMTGCRCNIRGKYDNFTLSDIQSALVEESIRLSLITPRKGLTELEALVTNVNSGIGVDVVNAIESADQHQVVKLAGFKLPPPSAVWAGVPPYTGVKRENPTSSPTITSNSPLQSSLDSSASAPKRQKTEDKPQSIQLPPQVPPQLMTQQQPQQPQQQPPPPAPQQQQQQQPPPQQQQQQPPQPQNQISQSSEQTPQEAPQPQVSTQQQGGPQSLAAQTSHQPQQQLPTTMPPQATASLQQQQLLQFLKQAQQQQSQQQQTQQQQQGSGRKPSGGNGIQTAMALAQQLTGQQITDPQTLRLLQQQLPSLLRNPAGLAMLAMQLKQSQAGQTKPTQGPPQQQQPQPQQQQQQQQQPQPTQSSAPTEQSSAATQPTSTIQSRQTPQQMPSAIQQLQAQLQGRQLSPQMQQQLVQIAQRQGPQAVALFLQQHQQAQGQPQQENPVSESLQQVRPTSSLTGAQGASPVVQASPLLGANGQVSLSPVLQSVPLPASPNLSGRSPRTVVNPPSAGRPPQATAQPQGQSNTSPLMGAQQNFLAQFLQQQQQQQQQNNDQSNGAMRTVHAQQILQQLKNAQLQQQQQQQQGQVGQGMQQPATQTPPQPSQLPQQQPVPVQQSPVQQAAAQSAQVRPGNGRVPTVLWSGQITWPMKDTISNQTRPGSVTVYALPVQQQRQGPPFAMEDYMVQSWPKRLVISRLMPAKIMVLQRLAAEHRLPYVQFIPPSADKENDRWLEMLTNTLEQKKMVACVNFAPGVNRFGMVLLYTMRKLVGFLFLKVPIPDLTTAGGPVAMGQAQQAGQPQGGQQQQQQAQQPQPQSQPQPPQQQQGQVQPQGQATPQQPQAQVNQQQLAQFLGQAMAPLQSQQNPAAQQAAALAGLQNIPASMVPGLLQQQMMNPLQRQQLQQLLATAAASGQLPNGLLQQGIGGAANNNAAGGTINLLALQQRLSQMQQQQQHQNPS